GDLVAVDVEPVSLVTDSRARAAEEQRDARPVRGSVGDLDRVPGGGPQLFGQVLTDLAGFVRPALRADDGVRTELERRSLVRVGLERCRDQRLVATRRLLRRCGGLLG